MPIFCLTLLVSFEAFGQNEPPAFDVQIFHPSLHGESVFDVESGTISPHLSYFVSTWLNFAEKPLSVENGNNGAALGDIVARRLDAHLVASLALFRWVTLGVEVPYVIHQEGINTETVQTAIGKTELRSHTLGDIRGGVKGRILLGEGWWPAMSVGVTGSFPSGRPKALAGQPGVGVDAFVALSKQFFGVHEVAFSGGYRIRTEEMRVGGFETQAVENENGAVEPGRRYGQVRVGNEAIFNLGYALTFTPPRHPTNWAFLFSLAGTIPQDGAFVDLTEHSLELRGALRYRHNIFGGFIDTTVGGGMALMPGYGGPMPRILASVSFLSINPRGDDDQDRVFNVDDKCPDLLEDLDDFQDGDGCPEDDNDQDGLPDEDDDCPNEPEDWDQIDDTDGCPDADPVDTDEDGIYDELDKCPNEPEDRDNFQDRDGCPEPDNDLDGLLDINDLCPNQAEDVDGDQDDDGCPDLGRKEVLVRLMGDRIVLRDPVTFTVGDQEVAPGSIAVFDKIVGFLLNEAKDRILLIQVYALQDGPKGKKAARKRIRVVRDLFGELGISQDRLKDEVRDYQTGRDGEVQFRFIDEESEFDFGGN